MGRDGTIAESKTPKQASTPRKWAAMGQKWQEWEIGCHDLHLQWIDDVLLTADPAKIQYGQAGCELEGDNGR